MPEKSVGRIENESRIRLKCTGRCCAFPGYSIQSLPNEIEFMDIQVQFNGCCGLGSLIAKINSDPEAITFQIGSSIFKKNKLVVKSTDSILGTVKHHLNFPLCCSNYFTVSDDQHKILYKIYPNFRIGNQTMQIISGDGNEEMGTIFHKHQLSMTQNFDMTFPSDCGANEKYLLLGAMFMISLAAGSSQ